MAVRSRVRARLVAPALLLLTAASGLPARADDGGSAPAAPSVPAIPPTTRPTGGERSPSRTGPAVSRADLEVRIRFLASDAMAGRFSTEPGGLAASQYVADEFARLGLKPRGDDGWFQPFEIPIPRLGVDNALTIVLEGARIPLVVEKDWNPLSVSPKRDVTGPLVFAGYGVENPDKAYDDFAGLDVKGKVVLVFRREPPWEGGPSAHATFLAKLNEAAERGAAALLVVNDPRSRGTNPDRLLSWNGALGAPPGSAKIPYAFVSQDAAERMLAPLGTSLGALQKAIDEAPGGPKAVSSAEVRNVSVRVATSIERSSGRNARNVCGFLPGADAALSREVVVVGAHHDHVGRGLVGSAGGPADEGKIHPGADDNASGTAAMLEIAETLATGEKRPRRSVLFLSFSGEELGLLGSVHYVNHPTVPLADMDVMVNCDMLGRYDEKRTMEIGGVGTGEGLKALVERANAPYGLALTWDPSGVAPSDNTSFFRKRVPVLFFFTGIHPDYHTPRDTADRINYVDAERVTAMCRDTVLELANRDARVAYTTPPLHSEPNRATLGIQPAPGSDAGGVVIASIVEGGAAAAAGLAEGDVIVAVGPYVVDSVRDIFKALGSLKPGEKVLVKYVRGTEHRTVDVVLGARK